MANHFHLGNRIIRGLGDPWLFLVWLAFLILGPVTLIIFVLGLPLLYQQLLTVCPSVCEDGRLTASTIAQFQEAGISLSFYAVLMSALAVALAMITFFVAGILLWKRPFDRMAVFTALLFILLGGTYSNADEFVGQLEPWLSTVTETINNIGFGLFPILLLTMPNGKFVPGWSRWLALFLFLFATIGANFPVSDLVFFLMLPVWALSGPLAQIYRYKRIANPIEKQQVKWVVAGMTFALTGFMVTVFVGDFLAVDEGAGPLATLGINLALYLAIAIIPISIAIGILRYRLWDIDLIIRKTVLYTLLTAVLGLVYFGTVVLLQSFAGRLTGEQSPLIIVLSTLLIAALFTPLRGRLQLIIDRRFFRKKYDAQLVLTQFSQVVRDETDMGVLVSQLSRVVHETVQPVFVGIWLKDRPS